jgi:transcriptional regulator with XRE-family HTH domain
MFILYDTTLRQMATSQQKSKVAQIRLITGETAEAFADIIGKSISTLRSLETGRLKLSEGTARQISEATGVNLAWLLDNKKRTPICCREHSSKPFSKESYIHHIAKKRCKGFINFSPELKLMLGFAIRGIHMAVYGAAEKGNGDIGLYYVEKFAAELCNQFPPPTDTRDAARQLIFLGERLTGMGVAEEDALGGSNVPLPTPRKKQPSRKSKRPA